MFSGFLHMLALLATHWQTWRPSRAPSSLRHWFLSFINSKGSDSEDGSGGVPCPLHTRPALSRTSHSDWRDHWRFGWSRSQCITVAQPRTRHCPLLASYLHRIKRQQSAVCPYCGGDDETAQRLLLCCPSHAQARSSTNYINSTDPWLM